MNVCFSGDLFTTNGATSGMVHVMNVLTTLDSVVYVEDPTYFIAKPIIEDDLQKNMVYGNLKL